MEIDMSKWTISQEDRTVRVRDGDGMLIAKFEHDKLTPDELEAMLEIYKFFFQSIADKLDDMIINGGTCKN